MYYFYNKDKIITIELSQGCSDSLTKGVPGGPSHTVQLSRQGSPANTPPTLPPHTPGWAELMLVFPRIEVT